jgi:acyl-CoA thioesterase-1
MYLYFYHLKDIMRRAALIVFVLIVILFSSACVNRNIDKSTVIPGNPNQKPISQPTATAAPIEETPISTPAPVETVTEELPPAPTPTPEEEMNVTAEPIPNNISNISAVSAKHYTILAFGDSLTEGYGLNKEDSYPSQLEVILSGKGYNVSVINEGVSSETTYNLLNRLDLVLVHNPDIVILTIGANDAYRFYPASDIKANIEKMIDSFNDNGATVVLGGMEAMHGVNTTAAVEFLKQEFNISDEIAKTLLGTATYLDEFKAIYPQIAEEKKVPFIPFFLEGVAGNPELNIEDGIHPNKDGYSIIVQNNILPVLLPLMNASS